MSLHSGNLFPGHPIEFESYLVFAKPPTFGFPPPAKCTVPKKLVDIFPSRELSVGQVTKQPYNRNDTAFYGNPPYQAPHASIADA